MPRPARLIAIAIAALLIAALAGCGSGEETSGGSSEEASPSATPTSEEPTESAEEPTEAQEQVVEVSIEGGEVDGPAEPVQVGIDEAVLLRLSSDEAGELHVHSTPEQEIAYDAGIADVELSFDRPGVVDVESHDLHQVLVRFEVR